jgi:hypothetical protein
MNNSKGNYLYFCELHDSITKRFWNKVEKTTSCWNWTGSIKKSGYGRFHLTHSLGVPAHRISYELTKGRIPKGLVLDHLCRNRHCVNPDHLEIVTVGENVKRGIGFAFTNSIKTHCKHGHGFTEDNIYWSRGWRHCLRCMRENSRGRYRITTALRDWFG